MFPTPSIMDLLNITGALARERVLGLMSYHGSLRPGHNVVVDGKCDLVFLMEFVVYGGIACSQKNRFGVFLTLLARWHEGGCWD